MNSAKQPIRQGMVRALLWGWLLCQANLPFDVLEVPNTADVQFGTGTQALEDLFELLFFLAEIPVGRGSRMRKTYLHQNRRSFVEQAGYSGFGFAARREQELAHGLSLSIQH